LLQIHQLPYVLLKVLLYLQVGSLINLLTLIQALLILLKLLQLAYLLLLSLRLKRDVPEIVDFLRFHCGLGPFAFFFFLEHHEEFLELPKLVGSDTFLLQPFFIVLFYVSLDFF